MKHGRDFWEGLTGGRTERIENKIVAAMAEALWDADARASGWRVDEARFADCTEKARFEMMLRASVVLAALNLKGHTVVAVDDERT